jgi:hypothetical protein
MRLQIQRMLRCTLLSALIFASVGQTRAENYCAELDLTCWPAYCYRCCPDNYCAKPSPGVSCLCWKGCCTPYCAKPMPSVPCVGGGGCYCYRPKPMPPVQSSCDPSYTCGPPCAPALDSVKQP